MHNALARLQATFGFFTSCAFTLAAIIAVLSIIPVPAPSGSPTALIAARNVQVVKGRPHYYSKTKEEFAQIRFDLTSDLSSLFTWNTKQIFVYVTANYPSTSGVEESESVIWDMIIPAPATPWSWQNLKQRYIPDKRDKRRKTSPRKSTGKAVTKPGQIALKNEKPKYVITDPSGKFADVRNATLQVNWNVQPWVGALLWNKGYFGPRVGTWHARKVGRSVPFDFPAVKGSQATKATIEDYVRPRGPEEGSAVPVVDV